MLNLNINTCKICNKRTNFHDNSTVLNKYSINYYFCPNCYFVQTEEPYWLEESYSKAIASIDTGIISRNILLSDQTVYLLKYFPEGNYLDYGGGHGIFTRLMRDYGFNFYHYDKYAENIYANFFVGNLEKKYTLITAFELFEHLSNPLEEIKKLFLLTDTIIFSTVLVSTPPPLIKDWWYYATTTGQHISFYTERTLHFIAKIYNCNFHTNNRNLHIFTKKKINTNIFKFLDRYIHFKSKLNLNKYYIKNSKTYQDMLYVIDNSINA